MTWPMEVVLQKANGIDKSMRVLIVDDFATMRRIVRNLLTELGFHNIVEADDGRTALPLLRGGGVDFLITDWNMSIMPGIELLKIVRSDPKLKDLPVMMVTAETHRDQIVRAAQEGVNGYIIKPFTAQTLEEKIHKIFAQTAGA
jgi:two-component system, chemotaxis family, chemotaxis protein CheY